MTPQARQARRRETMRDEMFMQDKIIALLRESPRTVPAVAAALEQPADSVLLWMMAMRRYGALVETGRPDEQGYFVYQLTPEEGHAPSKP
jgi:predicted Rossmann fold nucleotide-binding protein DprA/Smf involved in DNA uptake